MHVIFIITFLLVCLFFGRFLVKKNVQNVQNIIEKVSVDDFFPFFIFFAKTLFQNFGNKFLKKFLKTRNLFHINARQGIR